MKKSVVLFSGGIDSTTALYWALDHYGQVIPLTFDYGQRHKIEIQLSRRLTKSLKLPHQILKIDLAQIGGSVLTDQTLRLPKYEHLDQLAPGPPATYVPFRNGIFLALAAAWAEVRGIQDIICGFNVIDSPDYPDTRTTFVKAMERAVNEGTKAACGGKRFKIIAPFIAMKKSKIIRLGISLDADYSNAISCYAGEEVPCLKCSSCLLRKKAWTEIGLEDPLLVRLEKEGKL
jgi:7-cyano-7-deazaguanine synthase